MTPAESSAGDGVPALSVLLATDGSEHSLKAARFLAQLLAGSRAEVRLLTVLSMELDPHTYLGDLSDADARRARIEEEVEKAVGQARRLLEAVVEPPSVSCRFGNPPDETLAEIEAWHPDIVVVGRRGLGRAASLVLGSVSTFLLRHSTVPVLVVP
jgi:nucleotide-binding universal stress UspA family protein